VLYIDWAKFGKYELTMDVSACSGVGSALGRPESWRKMSRKRAFNEAELALFDSEWMFIHPGGEFKVEFKADGFNHFICKDFPAHSHWAIENDSTSADSSTPTVHIHWGKFGEYLVTLAADGLSFEGHAKNDPTNWRKGKRLGASGGHVACEHDH